eukprot:scaffold975_cov398-Prasinococcus_capsulatus_cf.AAC.8
MQHVKVSMICRDLCSDEGQTVYMSCSCAPCSAKPLPLVIVQVSALTMSIHCPLGIHTSAMYLTINPGSGAARVDMRRISSLPLDNWGEDLPSTLLLTLRDFLEHLSIKGEAPVDRV